MKKLITILALTALLSACGNSETTKTADTQTSEKASTTETSSAEAKATKYTTYSGEGFSFSYPDHWKSVDTSQLNVPALKAAFSNQEATQFADNVNFLIDANPSGETNPEAIANATVAYYEQNGQSIGVPEYKKTSYTKKPFKDYNAGVLEGTYNHPSGGEVVLIQYLIPSNAELYSLTLTYSKNYYEQKGKEQVNEILNSLVISSPIEQTKANTASLNQETVVTAADYFKELTPIITNDTAIMEQVSYDFFTAHDDLIPASTAEVRKKLKSLVDTKVTTKHLNKNVANYYEHFIQISGEVIEVEEDTSDGSTAAIVHIMDDNGNNVLAIYPSSTGDLLEGDYATVIGAPIANFSFENVGGGYTNATLIGAALVTAE
ncbi:hypothetical protein JNUCC31_17385 [Paenibacillus sp. JNUCC31]|uniref:PsbP-related protein n=1 Tax=Paenibacillus sp. JNUCC-31 TaxID=2777983 RepID=UPI0017864385|nr:PsbP-related protein [Paenibacillus sp. JNUCC-31]QOS76628.1 hypothetical protein JNUCC31_17385 [Paenibacillus sp. JNUCC-31]